MLRIALLGFVVIAAAAPALMAAPSAAEAAATANNQFALNLYRQVSPGGGNLFFSPASISTALAMTALGARGETAAQMDSVLGFPPADADKMQPAYAELVAQLNADGKDRGYQLTVANALWGQRGYGFMPKFLDDAKKLYGAGLNELDFLAPEPARKAINAWVEKATQDKIKDLIKEGMLGPDARLVLTNAIYFKGDWAVQFKKGATVDEPFFLTADKKANVTMMHQTLKAGYAADDDMKLIELPYVKNELEMVAILPKKVDGLADVEKGLDAKKVSQLLSQLRGRGDVEVSLPKFKINAELDLGETLKKLGMDLAFSDKADFTGMATKEQLAISKVVHKAFVDVNEEGTEAAGATAVGIRTLAVRADPPSFRADHPFMFLIRDVKSGAILFMGRVSDPTK